MFQVPEDRQLATLMLFHYWFNFFFISSSISVRYLIDQCCESLRDLLRSIGHNVGVCLYMD